jgi:trans-aconitate 2-methyltransferase
VVDWDAGRYHKLSGPQVEWGRRVLARLAPRPGERVLDLGCGTGRLTLEIVEATGCRVVGLDRSSAMITTAAQMPRVVAVLGDAAALPFAPVFDAVFSNAALHWVPDHEAAFASVHRVLRPGGRFVAQCGGGHNLRRLLDHAHELMESPRYRSYFGAWVDPWVFAGPEETRDRLVGAGFVDVRTDLEPAPTRLPDAAAFSEFIACVCVRHHVDRLPAAVRPAFVGELTARSAADDPPLTLDYWRLNIDARRAAA